jgi:aryl-alcohol dehydrogenase-like predicted oxidoreductase
MRYVVIPGSDLNVSAICLGSVSLGSALDAAASFALLDAYLAQGGNFIDTAKVYANWLPIEESSSEKTIGRWLKSRGVRERVVLATKGAHPDLKTMHISRLSRAEITGDVQASLTHLGVERIDLYWLHRDDPSRPVAEIMETMNDLARAGKIRYFGCSNWRIARIAEAQSYAAAHGLAGFVGDQMMWSLAAADPAAISDKTLVAMDAALWRYHQQSGLAAIPYSSQAGGWLQKMAAATAAAPANGSAPKTRPVYNTPGNRARLSRAQRLSAESGLTLTQIALGYLLSQPFVTIPIVGCRSLEQLADSLSAAEVRLGAAQMRYLESGDAAA